MRLLLALVLLGVGGGLTACSEEIGEAPERAAYFTLWGTLDPTTSHQALRVIPVLPQIDAETAQALGATVTTTDLASGQTYRWRDSSVVFASGRVGHVFHTAQAIGYGRSQLVRITRGDGATTSAYVRMPPDVTPLREVTLQPGGVNPDVQYPTYWPAAPQLAVRNVRYRVQDRRDCNFYTLTTAGDDGAVEAVPTESGWRTTLSLDRAAALSFGNRPAAHFRLYEITLDAEVSGADARPPGGVFDPELYFDPNAFTNVEQGFGLVVGTYRRTISWVPEPELLFRSGFGRWDTECKTLD